MNGPRVAAAAWPDGGNELFIIWVSHAGTMTDCAPHAFPAFPMSDPQAPLSAAVAMAESIGALLGAARALLRAGRTVDLAGLDELCGRLSARCLDLPPEQGRLVGPHLESLRDGLDLTTRLLAEGHGPTA